MKIIRRIFIDLYNLAVDSFKLSRDFQVEDGTVLMQVRLDGVSQTVEKGPVLCHSTIFFTTSPILDIIDREFLEIEFLLHGNSRCFDTF